MSKWLLIAIGSSALLAMVIAHPILFEPGYPAFHDLSPIWSFHQLFRPFNYPWDPYSNLGYPQVLPSNAIYNLGLMLLSIPVQGAMDLAHKFYIFLIVAFSCLSFALSLRSVKIAWVPCILGGIIFTANPFLQMRFIYGHNTIILANALSTIPIALLLRSLRDNSIKEGFLAGALIGGLAYLNPHISYMLAIASMPLITFTKLLDKKRQKRVKDLIYTAGSHYSAILASWSPILMRLKLEASSFNLTRIEESYLDLSIIQVIRDHFLEIILITVPLIIAFKKIGCGDFVEEGIKARLVPGFSAVALIGILLSSGGLKEMHPVYSILFTMIPGFWIFRDSSKFLYLIGLALAYLSGYFIDRAYSRFKDSRSKLISTLTITCILAVFLLQWNFYVFDRIGCTTLNEEFKSLFKELSSLNDSYRAFYIPAANWATRYSWQRRWFLDPVISLQEIPTIEIKGDEDVSRSSDLVRWVYASMAGNYTSNLRGLMRLLSAKYLVIRHDAYLPNFRGDLRFLSKISPSKGILTGFKKLWREGEYEIYFIEDAPKVLREVAGFTLIYGDRRTLLTALEDGYPLDEYPPVFIEDLIKSVKPDRILIDGKFLTLLTRSSKIKVINLARHAPISTKFSDRWVSGNLLWYLNNGAYSFAENGFIICKGACELSFVERVQPGTYQMYISYLTPDGNGHNCLLKTLVNDQFSVIKCNSTPSYKLAYLGTLVISNEELEAKIIKRGGCELALSNLYLVRQIGEPIDVDEAIIYFEDFDPAGGKIEEIYSPMFSNGRAASFEVIEINVPSLGPGKYEVYAKIISRNAGLVKCRLNNLEKILSINKPQGEIIKVGELDLTRGGNINIKFNKLSGSILMDYVKIKYMKTKRGIRGNNYLFYNVAAGRIWELDGKSPIALALGYAPIFELSGESFDLKYLGFKYTVVSNLIGLILLIILYIVTIFLEAKLRARRLHGN